ncbi:MAG TPA: hypothetical protein VFL41_04440 [Gaiellaceae bacterium]|nr:hypothetical protein [Gaiellaceae bacterium]HET8651546.1 hypothetical protein [Gaiellaceae bacterium]
MDLRPVVAGQAELERDDGRGKGGQDERSDDDSPWWVRNIHRRLGCGERGDDGLLLP